MQDRFKFRAYYKVDKKMHNVNAVIAQENCIELFEVGEEPSPEDFKSIITARKEMCVLIQCTGLKDKNGLNRLFEYDIIDGEGIKIGNYYENKDLLKTTTNYLIKRMGTKEWRNSEQEAIKRGCFYAE